MCFNYVVPMVWFIAAALTAQCKECMCCIIYLFLLLSCSLLTLVWDCLFIVSILTILCSYRLDCENGSIGRIHQ